MADGAPVDMLPCPFCGEAPVIYPAGAFNPEKHCVSCVSGDCDVSPSTDGLTRSSALAKWNTRALARPAAEGLGDAGVVAFGLGECIGIARRGFEAWAAKDHNRRWFRKIDGTPIPNDLPVNIAEAFADALAAAPPPPAPVGLVEVDAVKRLEIALASMTRQMWEQSKRADEADQRRVNAENDQVMMIDVQEHRNEAYQNGWDDGYAEGFGKATLSGQTGGAVPAGVGKRPKVSWEDLQAARAVDRARLAEQPGGGPADPRLAGLEHAEHIADHHHQRFLTLRDTRPHQANALAFKALGAKQVLDDIKAECARLATPNGSEG